MIRSVPRSRLLVVVVLATFLAAACSNGVTGGDFAARVDGTEITDAQVSHSARLYTFLAGLNQAPCGQAEEGESAESACNRFALGTLIQEELVKGYAAERDLSVTDETIDGALSQIEAMLGGREALEEQLGESDLTYDDLRELARRLLLFDEVQADLADAELTPERLRQEYDRQRTQFTELHTQHILVESLEEADRVREQVTPDNFRRLARELSTDPSAEDNGGDLGFLPAPQLDPAYTQLAMSLEPGEIGGPVQSSFGWHVIRLIDSRTQPFGRVRDQLRQQLSGEVFREWIQAGWADGEIDVNPRYGRFDPETGQVVSVRTNATDPPATEQPPAEQPTP